MDEFNNNTSPQKDGDDIYSKRSEDIIQDEPIYNTYSYSPIPEPASSKKEKKKYGIGAVILSAVLAAVISISGGAGVLYATGYFKSEDSPLLAEKSENDSSPQNNLNITIDETADSVVEAVNQKASPSVIGIRTTVVGSGFWGNSQESSGEGSGVIYSNDGYIITNYHVIADAVTYPNNSKIEVFLTSPSDDPYNASVIGYNISADIAVIKIDAKNLTPIEIADSDSLKVGQYVITIGAPGGLEFMGSVTYGIISGLDRVVSSDSDIKLIQTDAAINPGNSGGALVNAKGELVGINSSKIAAVEFEGMGFAIPSNTAVEICETIIEKGNSPEPYLGIAVSEKYTAEVLKRYNMPVGAVVASVAEGSPAAAIGLKPYDIITKFGDTDITEYDVLQKLVNKSTPGQSVTLTVYRNGKYYSAKVTIGSNNQVG